MRWPLPERSICKIYQALMTSHPPKPWFGPAPLSRLRSVASIPPQYTYMLLRSYYFYKQFLLPSVVKSSEERLPHRLSGKNQGFAQVRGLQASACLCQRFTLLIWRSIGAEPKLFLWNSLIKSSPVGDTFWRDGGMRFLCFSKSLNWAPYFKKSNCWDP
jgi:hypothetical protein